ncbi:MAG: hypothetical protein GF353_15430 [Candidatus Lokiarchaeota archaeon]|nr:hypothetical protein [Candidatus Lokiarchaeota archaeon]
METLRTAAQKSVLWNLDQTILTKHAFETSFNNKNGELVRIEFKDNRDFFFVVFQSNSGRKLKTIECPGTAFLSSEEFEITKFHEYRMKLSLWVNRILEEIMVAQKSPKDIFQDMRNNLDENSKRLEEPDKPFNIDEIDEWKKKLDDFFVQFDKLKEENKIQQHELNALRNDINKLKDTIDSLPKKTWIKAAGNKLLNVVERIANTKAGQALANSTIKALIGDGS